MQLDRSPVKLPKGNQPNGTTYCTCWGNGAYNPALSFKMCLWLTTSSLY